MDRLWSLPSQTLGLFIPACCATSTNFTVDGTASVVAALTSAGSLHCQSGVVSASISLLPSRKKDEPRKRRRGRFIGCNYKSTCLFSLVISGYRSRHCSERFKRLFGIRILRLNAQKILQNSFCLLLIVLQRVESSKIQIRLIEARHEADARLELLPRLLVILLTHEKNAEVVQRFGIIRAQLDRSLQISRCVLHLILLS